MKIEIIPKEKNTYPFLGINEKDDLIILFTERDKGIVIKSDNNVFHKQFSYRDDWLDSKFKLFNGTITLSND